MKRLITKISFPFKKSTKNEQSRSYDRKFILLLQTILLLLLFLPLKSQISIGLTIGGIGFHQGSTENAKFYKLKLDKKGRTVIFGAVNVTVSYRFNEYMGIRAMQSIIFHDSAGKFAGISHIGLAIHDDVIGLKNPRHHFSGSIGPFWYYRKGWSDISGYKNDPEFNTLSRDKKWERKFIWYGGFLKYDYFYDDDRSFSVDFLPGYPFIYALSAGWKCKLQ